MFRKQIRWAVILAVSTVGWAAADDISWDGGHTTDSWHQPQNWTDDTVPGPIDNAFIGDLPVAHFANVSLDGDAFVRSLEMTREVEVDTSTYELQVHCGSVTGSLIIEGYADDGRCTLYAGDRDPANPASSTNLDSIDADSIEVRTNGLLILVDGVVEVDKGELELNGGWLRGSGRIDLARTDGELNFDNNGFLFVGDVFATPGQEILIQNDPDIPGANGTIDLDGTAFDHGWINVGGRLIITAPLSDPIFNGIIVHDGIELFIADD